MTDKEKFETDCMRYMNQKYPERSPAIFIHREYGYLFLQWEHGQKWHVQWVDITAEEEQVNDYLHVYIKEAK